MSPARDPMSSHKEDILERGSFRAHTLAPLIHDARLQLASEPIHWSFGGPTVTPLSRYHLTVAMRSTLAALDGLATNQTHPRAKRGGGSTPTTAIIVNLVCHTSTKDGHRPASVAERVGKVEWTASGP